MLVSPTKIITHKILRNRTLNFETPDKNYQNMIFIPTMSADDRNSVINSPLFRPMQLLCFYVPKRFKPMGRNAEIIDQKTYYTDIKAATNGRIKKGKTLLTAYNGQNIVYDILPEYNKHKEIFSELRQGVAFQKFMGDYFDKLIEDKAQDADYTDKYIVFPLCTYIDDLKKKVTVDMKIVDPMILFLKDIFKGTLDKAKYKNIKFIFFYNPNANAIIKIDIRDPDFDKTMPTTLQKIYRMNNFNNGSDSLSDEDIDVGDINQLDNDDVIENKKEDIKNIILSKIAKTLRANNLTDFEAATRDEKAIIIAIDKKIESYLSNADNDSKTFEDLVAEIETDPDVKTTALRYVESKKINQQKLETMSKNLDKENAVIGSIQDLAGDDNINEADRFKVQIPDIDERIQTSRLSSFDEEYNKKQARKDLTAVLSGFSNSDYLPMTVDDIQIVDSSDDFNEKVTLSARYKTDDGKPLSFQLDIPKIVDKRYFYLGGNKKVISKQLTRLPIVKTKSDRVEITTNYNKITIERGSGTLSRRNVYILKLLKDFKNSKTISIEYGDNGITNGRTEYTNDFEYEELACSLSKITSPQFDMFFNRETIGEIINTLDISDEFIGSSKTPIGFRKKIDEYTSLIFIENSKIYEYDIENKTITELAPNMYEFIIKNILNIDSANALPSVGKSFMYTRAKFLKVSFPVFTMVGAINGLKNVLQRYGVKYYISDSKVKGDPNNVEIRFKDKYLYYEDTVRNTLLLNAIYLLDPEEYNLEEFDSDTPYNQYFIRTFGPSVGVHARNMLRLNIASFIDPITAEVLKDLKMPTNIVDLLLHANTLLVGNTYRPQNDIRNFRVRSNEVVYAVMYKLIADAYITYQSHRMNGNPKNISIAKNALISKLMQLPTVNDHSTLNPVLEMENIASCTAKGHAGINMSRAYTLELRAYDDSMNGIISGNATPYSGSAGITRSLSYDTNINSVRGYIPTIDQNTLSATNILSPTELLAAYTSSGADSPRQAMQVAQTKHTLPVLKTSKQLIGSGMNKTMAFMISDDFCFKAKKDGKVSKIDLENKLVLLDYDDGTKDAVDLSSKFDKNSNMGFYIRQDFKLVYRQGEKFKAGDILAYNESYFSGKGKNVDYRPGTLAKVAIASADFAYEDSTLISESLSKKCGAYINMPKAVSLGKNAVIHKIANIGDQVITNDHLLEFTSSFTDPETTSFIQSLQAQLGDDMFDEITHETINAKYTGRVSNIEIYYNCPFEELSNSLQVLISEYKKKIQKRKDALGDVHADSVHIPPLTQINAPKIGKTEFDKDGGVIIIFYIEYFDEMAEGDKLTYSTALKGVVSRRTKIEESPISEYRPEEHVEAILTPVGIISRMTSDIYSMLFGNKVLVELGKQIKEIWEDKR